ncbi:MAG: hypothetical protein ACSLE8_18345, partial [Rhodococcus sp. (in: high G+C Gram-positive bacteria)]
MITMHVRRGSVVGNAGSCRSCLAERPAATLNLPHVEFDAIHYLPSWEPIDPCEFLGAPSSSRNVPRLAGMDTAETVTQAVEILTA